MNIIKNKITSFFILFVAIVLITIFAVSCSTNKENQIVSIHSNDYKYALGNVRLNLHDCDLDYTPQFHTYLDNHTFDMLDVDFRKTKDGVWVACHLEEATDLKCVKQPFKVAEKTFSEVQELCLPGNEPMTIDEFCEYAKNNDVVLQLESKLDGIESKKELLDIINKHDALPYIVYSGGDYKNIEEAISAGYHKVMGWDALSTKRINNDEGVSKEQIEKWDKELKEKYPNDGEVWLNTMWEQYDGWIDNALSRQYIDRGFYMEVGCNWKRPFEISSYIDLLSYYDINSLSSIKMECSAKTSDGDLGRQIRYIFEAYDKIYGKKINFTCAKENGEIIINNENSNLIDIIPPGSIIEQFNDSEGSPCLKIKYNRRKDGDGVSGPDKISIIKINLINKDNSSFDGWYINGNKMPNNYKVVDDINIDTRFK